MQNGQSTTKTKNRDFDAFYLESDRKRARIGLLLLIFPIVLFAVNDFLFFGLGSQIFYGLAALRVGLVISTIVLLIFLNRITSYSKYVGLMAGWTIAAAISVVAINLTRPPSFIPLQLVTAILFVLIAFAVIPNRLRYQIISAGVISFGEIGILLFYSTMITGNALTTGLGSIILAFIIGVVSSWQLEIYRKNNFEAHEQLRQSRDQSQERYEQLVEKLPEMVFEINANGEVTFANQRARELTGYSKEELEDNFDANRLVAPEDIERSKANMKLMFAGGMRQSNEYTWIRKDGTRFPVLLTSSPVMEEGKVLGARGIIADLTEHKRLEKQVQDNERLVAIGQTAGMVGHDLRNPLQSIIGEVYLAKSEIDSLPVGENKRCLQESVQAIEEQISYMDKIVSDLQTFMKPVEAKMEIINLESLITALLAQTDFPKNIQASTQIDDKLIVNADAQLLKRVLINLVTNAVQAMPDGGELIIKARTNDKKQIQIIVEDTGTGIPEEIKSKIFTPLFTTKSKGQGFGLAVCKRVIEAQGGTITFESEVGKGTKFIIELPAQG